MPAWTPRWPNGPQALQEANAAILGEQERKHRLMLNIFHDLRSPLFVLRGYTDMLQPQTRAGRLP